MSGYDSGGLASALITTRDGIVGPWVPPDVNPGELDTELADNINRWSPRVRGAVLDFELANRLAFTTDPAPAVAPGNVTGRTAMLWHTGLPSRAAHTDPWTTTLAPIAKMDRPAITTFEEQLVFLESYADLRPDRATEILEQLQSPVPFLASAVFLRADTKRWTMELIDMVIRLCRLVEYRFKHSLACRRPNEFSPQVQPIILTPSHGTLPSGHATEAFAAASILWLLLQDTTTNPYGHASYGEQFMRIAARIAINRTVAGVHFPIDSVAGAMLGVTLANYVFARSQVDPSKRKYSSYHFDGTVVAAATEDFDWTASVDTSNNTPAVNTGINSHPSLKVFNDHNHTNLIDLGADQSLLLEFLWTEAKKEWT
jgi:membrane-associated phospholipid phosphatase